MSQKRSFLTRRPFARYQFDLEHMCRTLRV